MGKSDLSSFFFVRSSPFLTGVFPVAKPRTPPLLFCHWFDDFGSEHRRAPRVLLSLFFHHTDSCDMDLVEMFPLKAVVCIAWGDLPGFSMAPCLLDACLRGMIESLSFSLWTVASIFFSLEDSGCIPEKDIFLQLISSLTVFLNLQATTSFASASFQKPKQWETASCPSS